MTQRLHILGDRLVGKAERRRLTCYKHVIMTRRSCILGDRPVGTSRVESF
jgi:hypothetical protein